ncbi:unnamed protein product [Rhizophagus irregularis]|nr:unnamed protein product [Rhizophagus irregularis]CAB4439077.1 unnamed protein product [Rhizophagus irregularis]
MKTDNQTRSKCDIILFDEYVDDFELTGWKFDTQVPGWWHIIDVSDLKIAQDFLSEAKLNFKISFTLNMEIL